MLAARQFCFLFPLVAFFALAALSLSSPLLAQVQGVPAMEFHGVPPSGFGGTSAGFSSVRPGATMPGYGAAFGCCASFFFPSSFSPMVPYPSVVTAHREHRHHRRNNQNGVVGVAEPVYIPYAVPYAADSDDAAEDQDDTGAVASSDGGEETGGLSATRRGKSGGRRLATNGVPEDPDQKAAADPAVEEVPAAPEDPVVAQPTTVLVFKDGHRSEVVNYAIVGDTLFDFSGDRTHKIPIADLDIPATQKANDASGVEFKLPPAGQAAGNSKSATN